MYHVYPKHNLTATSVRSSWAGALKKFLLFIVFLPMFLLARAQAPHIQSFFPDSARTNDTVRIVGSHLDSVSAVSFGGVPARSFIIFSDSLVWGIVGNGASGAVSVSSPAGSDSLGGFLYLSPAVQPPVINSFTPDSGTTGTVVTLLGAHFLTTTSVQFGGVSASSFSVVSDSVIRAVVGAGATGAVRVFNRAGQGTAASLFTFIAPPPPAAPHITSFFPDSARTNDTVRIVGIRLDSVNAVRFGGVPARSFTIVSDSLIWGIVGTGASGAVSVSSAAGSDSLGGFIFLSSPSIQPPVINSFTPDSGTTGTVVTLLGAHFLTTTSVQFAGVSASSFSVVSDSMIRAVVGSGATGAVKVYNSAGLGTAANVFTFIAPPPAAPHINSFFPDSARTNDTVRIVGIRLDSVNAVSFGGVPARSFTIISDSLIWAVVGTGASGQVRVASAAGSDSLSGFIFLPPHSRKHRGLTVYPNPVTNGTFTVQVPETTTPSRFVLADASGHAVLTIPVSSGVQQMLIPVSRFNKGIYKLVWSNGHSTASQTILLLQ